MPWPQVYETRQATWGSGVRPPHFFADRERALAPSVALRHRKHEPSPKVLLRGWPRNRRCRWVHTFARSICHALQAHQSRPCVQRQR